MHFILKVIGSILSALLIASALIAIHYQSKLRYVPDFPKWVRVTTVGAIALGVTSLLVGVTSVASHATSTLCMFLLVVVTVRKAFVTYKAYQLLANTPSVAESNKDNG